jgi:hypothetical protein
MTGAMIQQKFFGKRTLEKERGDKSHAVKRTLLKE